MNNIPIGVQNADVVIALMDDPKYPYRGTLFELGVALGLNKRVFVVTPYLKFDPENVFFHEVCFYYLKGITHVEAVAEALDRM